VQADGQWIRARLGGFETISDDGRKAAIQGLSQFEQFRHVLGVAMGKADLSLDPPVRILVFKDLKELAAQGCKGWQEGRDKVMACTAAEGQLPPALTRELTRRLLEANFASLPAPVVEKTRFIPRGKGMAGLAWERDRVVSTCNLKTDPNQPPAQPPSQ